MSCILLFRIETVCLGPNGTLKDTPATYQNTNLIFCWLRKINQNLTFLNSSKRFLLVTKGWCIIGRLCYSLHQGSWSKCSPSAFVSMYCSFNVYYSRCQRNNAFFDCDILTFLDNSKSLTLLVTKYAIIGRLCDRMHQRKSEPVEVLVVCLYVHVRSPFCGFTFYYSSSWYQRVEIFDYGTRWRFFSFHSVKPAYTIHACW